MLAQCWKVLPKPDMGNDYPKVSQPEGGFFEKVKSVIFKDVFFDPRLPSDRWRQLYVSWCPLFPRIGTTSFESGYLDSTKEVADNDET
jgi:hypothetical protein